MRNRWKIALLVCIIIFSMVFLNYVFANKKSTGGDVNKEMSEIIDKSKFSISKTEARKLAERQFSKSIQEEDPVFHPWKESAIGEPILVRTVEGEPSYWTVPVTFKGKVIGFIDVDRNKSIPRYGAFGGTPNDLSTFPSVLTFTTPEEAFELAKNITAQYPGAKVSAPLFVYDGEPGRTVWMLKVESKGKTISRVFVAGGRYVYEKKAEEASKNVAGIDIAFEENISENEVRTILGNYNLTLPYKLNYNVTYIHPVFYIIIPEQDFETLKTNLQGKEVYLQKTSIKRNGQIIVLIDTILSENQTISTMESYSLSFKRFGWISIDYQGSLISEDNGGTIKENLEKNEKVIYVNLVARKCC